MNAKIEYKGKMPEIGSIKKLTKLTGAAGLLFTAQDAAECHFMNFFSMVDVFSSAALNVTLLKRL